MKRRSKYGNVKTVVDGHTFDSKREARRYGELLLLLKAREIFDLTLQPAFPCEVNGKFVCSYLADFMYRKRGGMIYTVEDVKGVRTALYRLKKKLVFACHRIEIQEV